MTERSRPARRTGHPPREPGWRRPLEWLKPRRTIRPTRDGWWCLGAAVGLGFAAVNTGNNLLYLLASLLLARIVVSASSPSSRSGGCTCARRSRGDLCGAPVRLGARVLNRSDDALVLLALEASHHRPLHRPLAPATSAC